MYAHEIFVLNGAVPNRSYTVARNLFFADPGCQGNGFSDDVAVLETNAAGNARAGAFIAPTAVAGFEGVHGVLWEVRDARGAVVYRTACTAVRLD